MSFFNFYEVLFSEGAMRGHAPHVHSLAQFVACPLVHVFWVQQQINKCVKPSDVSKTRTNVYILEHILWEGT